MFTKVFIFYNMQKSASKKVQVSWAMYDWANSVYNLVITATFFPIYFLIVTKQPQWDNGKSVTVLGMKFINSSLYDYCIGIAYFLIALCYPILTSIADNRGAKKKFLKFFCYLGAIGCSSLFFFTKDSLWVGILGLMCGAMGYVGSLVFYNAFLPEIAAVEDRDRISAKGFAFGYIGSVILQVIGFAMVTVMEDKLLAMRITFLTVGIWWIGFAQITFKNLPETPIPATNKNNIFKEGFNNIKKVWHETRQLPVLKRFLRAFFFYSMGVQTVMLAATQFGSQTLAMESTKLIASILIIQLVAIAGAFGMSKLSEKYGNIKVLMGVVCLWIFICLAAFYTANVAEPLAPYHDHVFNLENLRDGLKKGSAEFERLENEITSYKATFRHLQQPVEYMFYTIAVLVGLVMGGIQSLSRSTFSKLMPETKNTSSYFTYYDFNEKLAIVIGMICFGFIHEISGSMKFSVLNLVVFFATGLVWLYFALRKQKELAK